MKSGRTAPLIKAIIGAISLTLREGRISKTTIAAPSKKSIKFFNKSFPNNFLLGIIVAFIRVSFSSFLTEFNW